MTARKRISLCLLGLVITTGLTRADRLNFTGQEGDDNWTNANNWVYHKSNPPKTGVPGADDEARIGYSTVRITTEVTVGYLKNGVDGVGKVVIDGGSLVTVGDGTKHYNSACYNSPGYFIIQNGGAATFNRYFMVGFKKTTGGIVEINEGTLRVADGYFHNHEYTGSEKLNTRTTINPGGLLDVDSLTLNAGVMDLAGGTLIIRRSIAIELNQWIADGRIIAMGGEAGWKIKVTLDATTGWTTLVAEPVTEPFTVGTLNPVTPDPSRPAA